MARSAIVRELSRFMRHNQTEIAIDTCQGPLVDPDSVSFIVSPCGPLHPPIASSSRAPIIFLDSIDLEIISGPRHPRKRSTEPSSQEYDSAGGVFAVDTDLNVLVTWVHLLGRFFAAQVIRRYPLIFGQWRIKKYTESLLFPSISHSVSSMVLHSNNRALKRQAKHAFVCIESQQERRVDNAWAALETIYFASTSDPIITQKDAQESRQALSVSPITPPDPEIDDDEEEEETRRLFCSRICDALSMIYDSKVPSGRKIKFNQLNISVEGPDGPLLGDDEGYIHSPPSSLHSDDLEGQHILPPAYNLFAHRNTDFFPEEEIADCYQKSLSSALSAFDTDLEDSEPSVIDYEPHPDYTKDADDMSSIITCDFDPAPLPNSTADASIEGRHSPMIGSHRDRIEFRGDSQEMLLDGLPHDFPIIAASIHDIVTFKPARSVDAADLIYSTGIHDGTSGNYADLDAAFSDLSFEDGDVSSIASSYSSLASPLSARAFCGLEEAEHVDDMPLSPASSISWRS